MKFETIPVYRESYDGAFADLMRDMNSKGYFYHQTNDLVLRKQYNIIGFFIKETS